MRYALCVHAPNWNSMLHTHGKETFPAPPGRAPVKFYPHCQFSILNSLSLKILCPSVLKKRYALRAHALNWNSTLQAYGNKTIPAPPGCAPVKLYPHCQFSILCPSKSSVPLSLCFEKTLRVTRSRAALEFDATGLRKRDDSGSTSARSSQALPPLSILNRQFSILCPSVPLF